MLLGCPLLRSLNLYLAIKVAICLCRQAIRGVFTQELEGNGEMLYEAGGGGNLKLWVCNLRPSQPSCSPVSPLEACNIQGNALGLDVLGSHVAVLGDYSRLCSW